MIRTILIGGLLFAAFTANSQQKNPAVEELKREANPEVLQQKLKILGDGNEDDRLIVMNYYDAVGNARKADSVLQATIKKYPKGNIAYIKSVNDLTGERDVEKKELMVKRIFETFAQVDSSRLYHSLAYGYASSKNVPKVVENIGRITKEEKKINTTLIVARLIMNYDLPAAESLVRAQIDAVIRRGVPPPPPKVGDTGPNGNARPAYFMFLGMYAEILIRQGKYQEALKYSKDVYVESGGRQD